MSVGAQGVLIVDAQFPELVPRYLAAIRELGGRNVDFAINTHWHYDHADGNLVLGPPARGSSRTRTRARC